MKTLIVAQGLERERIVAAISVHSPDKLVILRSKKDVTPELTESVNKHIKILREELFPSDKKIKPFPFLLEIDEGTKVDFFDLPLAITEINARVKEELSRGNEVSIDISSGNKIVAIALFLVAQINGLRVTYCSAGKYASMCNDSSKETIIPEQIAFSVRERFEIPLIPLKFETIPTEILKKLNEINGRVQSIRELAEQIYPSREIGKREIIEISRKLEILESYDYITSKRKGRNMNIEITNSGRKVIILDPIISGNKS